MQSDMLQTANRGTQDSQQIFRPASLRLVQRAICKLSSWVSLDWFVLKEGVEGFAKSQRLLG